MSDTKKEVTVQVVGRAFPFWAILCLLFVAAKLLHLISWSWWLVLLPAWGPIVLGLGFGLVFLVGFLVFLFITRDRDTK